MKTRQYARAFLKRYGWQPVPVPTRRKGPVLVAWQNLRLTDEEIPQYFADDDNLGVLLGEPSGGLVDVDLDCEEAVQLAPHFLSDTLRFGRAGNPDSHWLYVATPVPVTKKYQIHRTEGGRRTSETLVELRSTGCQTLFPPSVHPSGERIAFANETAPLRIDAAELTRRVKMLAVACLFLRAWPRGSGARQDHAQALAGALIRSGFTEAGAERLLYAVVLCAGDEEAGARAKTATYAARHKAEGTRFWGWPKVAELFGEQTATCARAWLGAEAAGAPDEGDAEAMPTEAPALPQNAYELLPALLREATLYFDTWHRRDVFLTALLGALSSALPNVRFLYGQQYHSPHLYFFVLARAASGKGAMPHAFRWLDAVDALLQKEWLQEHEAWQQRKDACEQAKRSRKETPLMPEAPGPEPPERCLKAGANTTAAALGGRLSANPEGVFIGSTEADTLSSSNRREHGDFSHLIRKAFHHEEAQIDRKTDGTLRIKHPRLALALSGTRKQFPRFMEGGVEDGSYSRFGVYSFEAPAAFVSQRSTKKDHELDAFTERASQRVLELYTMLRGRQDVLYFDVPDELWDRMDERFRALHDSLAARGSYDLLASVRRGVLIAFRIAMVLSLWRHFEQGTALEEVQHINATEADIEAGRALGLVYVEHALREALRMEPGIGKLPNTDAVGGSYRMIGAQRRFFDALPEAFETREAWEVFARLDGREKPPKSTFHDWLGRLTDAGLLEKPEHGQYHKRPVARGNEKSIGLLDSLDFPRKTAKNGDPALDFPLDSLDFAGATSDGEGVKVQESNQSPIKVQSKSNQKTPQTVPKTAKVQKSNQSPIATTASLHVGQRVETSQGPGTVAKETVARQKVKVLVDALAGKPMPERAFDAADLRPLYDAPPVGP